MNIGIVGLPNVGKSTLFRALTAQQVDIANYPFCTIQPNTGIVKVPDTRLNALATLSQSHQVIPAAIEFVDIAGLVKGAHEGAGLGNQFLAHIREVDAITHVVRVFSSGDITHVDGNIDPVRDIETIDMELVFADMVTIEKRLSTLKAKAKSGASQKEIDFIALIEKVSAALDGGTKVSSLSLSKDEYDQIKDLHLLSAKPIIIVANIDEGVPSPEALRRIQNAAQGAIVIPICARTEADSLELSQEELRELGIERVGLDAFIRASYETLSLITYFTTGPKETRAWTIPRGTRAPQAAGVIHTDFEKGFIRAEVINWKELIDAGSELAAKEKGLIRLEGKEYVAQDGDVMVFRFQS